VIRGRHLSGYTGSLALLESAQEGKEDLAASHLREKVQPGICKAFKVTDPSPWVGKEAFPMDRPWFDQETDVLLLDEYIVEMDSYKRIVEDGTITDTELLEQTLRVVTLLRQLEDALSPEAKALATEAFGEMAVLNALQALRLQASSPLP
jgi:hypothetical protein